MNKIFSFITQSNNENGIHLTNAPDLESALKTLNATLTASSPNKPSTYQFVGSIVPEELMKSLQLPQTILNIPEAPILPIVEEKARPTLENMIEYVKSQGYRVSKKPSNLSS